MELVELGTERLILRCPAGVDVDRIFAICQDPDIAAFTTVPYPYRREDAAGFVNAVVPAGWSAGTGLAWGIYLNGAPELLGMISLVEVRAGAAEIGYWIDPLVRVQGLMTEAAARVVEFGFAAAPDGLGLRRIGWKAIDTNRASARVAQKVGFRWEGRSRGAAVRPGAAHDLSVAALLSTHDRSVPVPWPDATERTVSSRGPARLATRASGG